MLFSDKEFMEKIGGSGCTLGAVGSRYKYVGSAMLLACTVFS